MFLVDYGYISNTIICTSLNKQWISKDLAYVLTATYFCKVNSKITTAKLSSFDKGLYSVKGLKENDNQSFLFKFN